MKPLNCLIVDDEPIAREGIAAYCKNVSFLKVVALCKNALQADQYLQTHQIDLIFLDINMPLLSGINWLKSLDRSPMVIMTTAYTEYALESFSYEVIDYLVKPISLQRFTQAIQKVKRYCKDESSKEVLFVKSDKQLIKVPINNILFIEAKQNYVKIFTVDETIIARLSLKVIKEQLPSYFIQTHKSYLVAKYKIEKVVRNEIIIQDYTIPISVRLKKKVLGSL